MLKQSDIRLMASWIATVFRIVVKLNVYGAITSGINAHISHMPKENVITGH